MGFTPDVVVGDADSLPPDAADKLRADGVEVVVHPDGKGRERHGARRARGARAWRDAMLVIGAFGGARLEHTIANLLLLALPDLDGRRRRASRTARARCASLDGGRSLTIDGQRGDFVSLFPLAPVVDGVTTERSRVTRCATSH